MTEFTLDCTGMNCPVPIVRISQRFKTLEPGSRLVVTADDPAFGADVRAWTRRLGHELLEFEAGPTQRAVIRKSGAGGTSA